MSFVNSALSILDFSWKDIKRVEAKFMRNLRSLMLSEISLYYSQPSASFQLNLYYVEYTDWFTFSTPNLYYNSTDKNLRQIFLLQNNKLATE